MSRVQGIRSKPTTLKRGLKKTESFKSWFKEAVIYQIHVKSFADSNGDGIGDFQGLIKKLDYLQELGVTALWLLPFYPSPMKDDGYDVADYTSVHPQYGTLRDFQDFLDEAHRRGLKIITELMLNHTSDQHEWFQKSRRAKPGSKWRNFYVWSDTPQRYADARILFEDFETSNWAWDPLAKAYFWHRFYSHQPDLNFDSSGVRKQIFRVVDFWLDMGVDGYRLDSIPYLYEREGTNCENLPETHEFLKEIREHIDKKYQDRMLLAEADQWPEDAVAYFGKDDECQMAFHFPLMSRLFMALQMEDRYPIVEILEQTPPIPASCQWAIFLRNHDELTLKMMTDEDRDYMYHFYAKDFDARINLGICRRLAPLLSNNRRKIELLNILLFSLPGTPIIYYGDEIGMGDNIYLGDRNGVRSPMQWNADKNAGFSRANPQKLFLPIIVDSEYHYEAINVEVQENNLSSLLWWMRNLIAMRKKCKALSYGKIQFLMPENNKVLSFLREYKGETMLVIANLSHFAQNIKLDLSRFAGLEPEEVFSHNRFELIRETPYVMLLGPLDVFWFVLKHPLMITDGWPLRSSYKLSNKPDDRYWISADKHAEFVNQALPTYLSKCFWLTERPIQIHDITIQECIPMNLSSSKNDVVYLLILQTFYEGNSEILFMPVQIVDEKNGRALFENHSEYIIARFKSSNGRGAIFDAAYDSRFHAALLKLTASRHKLQGLHGKMISHAQKNLFKARQKKLPRRSQLFTINRGSDWIDFENQFSLKLYRRLREGKNPEEEVSYYLHQETSFNNIAHVTGAMEYKSNKGESFPIGIFQTFIHQECDAWTLTLDALTRYYNRILANKTYLPDLSDNKTFKQTLKELPSKIPQILEDIYLNHVRLLAQRTAEMHLALSKKTKNPDFKPEIFSLYHQRTTYQLMLETLNRTMRTLKQKIDFFSGDELIQAKECIRLENAISQIQKNITSKKIQAIRTRTHGNYHLGNILFTGKDFIIINFEGDIRRLFSDRKIKRSPFKDVAMLLRSFHFAAFHSLLKSRSFRADDIKFLTGYANLWFEYVSKIVLEKYLQVSSKAPFISQNNEDIILMLQAFLLERMIGELAVILDYDPQWAIIPINGIVHLIKTDFAFLKT